MVCYKQQQITNLTLEINAIDVNLITNAYVNRTYTSGLVNIVLFSIISFFTRCSSQSIWERICFLPLEDWDWELASSASSSFVSK